MPNTYIGPPPGNRDMPSAILINMEFVAYTYDLIGPDWVEIEKNRVDGKLGRYPRKVAEGYVAHLYESSKK